MKKSLFLPVLIVSFFVLFISFAKATNHSEAGIVLKDSVMATDSSSASLVSLSEKLFADLELEAKGLSIEALDYAVAGYQKLVNSGLVSNSQYLTIVDFSQSSRKKRFYILDMHNNELTWNTFVSHGKNSGVDRADRFSNKVNSEQSSLGFYVTKKTYHGKHGLSLRLAGLEEGFNSNAEARGIVVHGAAYVNAGRVNSAYMGRSQGCPALPESEYAAIINLIKDGSVMFVYNPSEEYLQSSTVLN